MIPLPLLFTLAFLEMSVVVGLLSETRMKKLLMLGLGWVKRGRGHLVVRTVAATFTMVFGSALFDVVNYRRRMSETGKRINPTYEVLITNHLLETSLMGFCLFLYMLIDRLHCYMRQLLEDTKNSSQLN
ncbi:uncharacterized protein LOC116192029 [Punica granatum]|uniref:Endoplasmic reticulum transmembrane protein n=1 Tax=Punica granatum TaxID=22663 RepID=A0A6P8C4Q5_PUNGR|nr:uncharacterized protein LOC116192029 [Punica granatum]